MEGVIHPEVVVGIVNIITSIPTTSKIMRIMIELPAQLLA